MKKFKLALLSAVALVLVGCGGHGYEGKYSVEQLDRVTDSTEMINGEEAMIVGSNYLIMNGIRDEYAKIVPNGEYLECFEKEDGEVTFILHIVNDSTLVMDDGLRYRYTFQKI